MRGFPCWDQFLAMTFAQVTYRESPFAAEAREQLLLVLIAAHFALLAVVPFPGAGICGAAQQCGGNRRGSQAGQKVAA